MPVDISNNFKRYISVLLCMMFYLLINSHTPIVFAASKGGILEVKALKLYQTSSSHAAMDIQFVNTSPDDIKGWSINVEIYDKNENYLGHSIGGVDHIRSGEAKIEEIIFLNIQATEISSWTATLDAVVGYSGLREDQKYIMKIRK